MGRKTLFISLLFATGAAAAVAAASQEQVLGVAPPQLGQKLVDEKCLACHNRQRIEAALRERKRMEGIVRRMEKKGVVLTAKERQILSHFWQKSPFKGEEGKVPSPQVKEGAPSH